MRKIRKIWLVVPALLIIGVLAWFFFFRSGEGAAVDLENAVYVERISDMGQYNVFYADRYSGVVEAQETVKVRKDSNKEIKDIYVAQGEMVTEGQALFVYDVTSAQNNITAANLDIEGINNEISALDNEIKELTAQRDRVSEDEKLDYTTEIQSKQMQVRQYEYEKQGKEKELEGYRAEIGNATVYAPITGTIKTLNPETSYDNYGNEQSFMEITRTGEYRVKGKLTEQSMGTIVQGQGIIVRSRVDETKTWNGAVTEISTEPASDDSQGYYGMSGERSSQYPFYVSLDNVDGLMLGQHVYIEPDYGQSQVKEGIWIDQSYVAYNDNGEPFVWAANGRNKIEKRKVTLGAFDEETWQYEIVSGLSLDDKIAWPDESLAEGKDVITSEMMQSMYSEELE